MTVERTCQATCVSRPAAPPAGYPRAPLPPVRATTLAAPATTETRRHTHWMPHHHRHIQGASGRRHAIRRYQPTTMKVGNRTLLRELLRRGRPCRDYAQAGAPLPLAGHRERRRLNQRPDCVTRPRRHGACERAARLGHWDAVPPLMAPAVAGRSATGSHRRATPTR
ncbi:hypothetical protein BS78_05G215600 [Paspalum vaginatum]|nr:hypothetical protein BS78_05G215600 [Paspalum vaginatum]